MHAFYRINTLTEAHPAKLTTSPLGACYRVALNSEGTQSIELHLTKNELLGALDLIAIRERATAQATPGDAMEALWR